MMSDFDDLRDAFAELERRADVATLHRADDAVITRSKRQTPPLLIVAAAVVAVLAVSLGVALFARGHRSAAPGGPAAGAPPASTAPTPAAPTARSASAVTRTPPAPVPASARELAKRFRTVLGGTASFTVRLAEDNRSSHDPYIVGVLTASGRRGGFDLQMLPTTPGSKAMCDAAPNGSTSTCVKHRLPNGSSLALGSVSVTGDDVTYQADLITKGGIELLMHVSNEADPKGESSVLSAKPPLTMKHLKTVITSPRWFD